MRLANLRQAVNAALAGEAVPQLNIKGNTFTLMNDGATKVVTQIADNGRMYVDVHFVDCALTTSKQYYKDKFSNDEDKQVAPTCFSEDSIAPSNQSEQKQAEQCSMCQWNAWGTAIGDEGTGKGKRCRDMWKTAVIVPSFSPDMIFQLRIPPASLKAWKAYMATFAEFEVNGREGNVGDVITRVYFEQQKQGQLNFEPVAMASPEQQAFLEYVGEKDLAAYLIGLASAPPALAAPAKQKMIEAPKDTTASAIANYAAKEQAHARQELQAQQMAAKEKAKPAEEDEVTKLRRQLAEAQAKAGQSSVQPKSSGMGGLPKAASGAGQPKAALVNKPKGAIELSPGMRTKTGTVIPPEAKKGVSKFAAAMAAAEDVEEESLHSDSAHAEAPQTNALSGLVKKERTIETPSGIPATQLPAELQNLLAGVLGK